MKAVINANLYDFDTFRPGCFLLYDGQIVQTGPMAEYRKPTGCTEELDACGALVMPSLVITHAHLYGAYLRAFNPGVFHPLTFRELLQQLFWKLDGGLGLESSYYSAKAMAFDHIRCGVTTIFDHHASGRAIRGTLEQLKRAWVDESGLRGAFCFETSDRFPVADCIAENVEFANAHSRGDKWARGMFGLHASMTLSEDTLRKVSGAIGGVPLHSHVAESLEDQQECIALYNKRIVERFLGHGLITPDSIFAHCVNINEREAALAAENSAHVALNISSNLNAGHGCVDYRMLRRFGVKAIFGNDSLGTNIAAEIRNFVFAEHTVCNNVFTVGGADALACIRNGYEHANALLGTKLGRLEAGYEADMLLADYIPYTPMNAENAWDHVFDGVFHQFRPRHVWCAGVQKLRDYRVLLDEEKTCAESRAVAEKLWASI